MTLFDPMMKAMDEIEAQIMTTRDALVDVDKEFETTVDFC